MNTTLIKAAINNSFSRRASVYEEYANVQGRTAQVLAKFLQEDLDIPPGPVLELGCGTGIFTAHLLRLFADRSITATDTSQSMLDQCELMLNPMPNHIQLALMDAEECNSEQKYAIIVASFSLQWVTDFYATIERLLAALQPGGHLIFAVPLKGSFSEWHEQCLHADVPWTVNSLPEKTQLIDWCKDNAVTLEWLQQPIVCRYSSSLDFFRSLKGVGASVNTSGFSLTAKQLRRLLQTWDSNCNQQVQVTYNVLCGRVTRGYDK